MSTPEATADVGLVGLAVMGQNLALNMADHGFTVAVYNRTTSKTDAFMAEHPAGTFGEAGGGLVAAHTPEELVRALKRPRRIVAMVKAGPATDAVIDQLAPLLDKGDLIVDGGNAHWDDTIRREKALAERGILFMGSGVSGGEEGARYGPSLMPGGSREAWKLLEPVWTAIAAKVDETTGKPIEGGTPGHPVKGGTPCTAYMGPGAAGHYVKMVHNGIEYGDMQMICEAYHLLRVLGGFEPEQLSDIFAVWNRGELDSFLIEITADILRQKDPKTGEPLVDVVLDAAGQKGTGRWTSIAALELGAPAATIAEAVFARFISAMKEERVAAAAELGGPDPEAGRVPGFDGPDDFAAAVGEALYCSKICSYAQGFQLLRLASQERSWDLHPGEIAMIWRGGCIIRARFLQKIREAYDRKPDLSNLLLDPYFAGVVDGGGSAWRRVVAAGAMGGIPVPAFGSALSYYDSYRTARLPASLLQAQRDYFGAHTYERTDAPRGAFFHLDWLEPGRPEVPA